MKNPNPYNALRYTHASHGLNGATAGMWKAGALIDDIVEAVEKALTAAVGTEYRLDVDEVEYVSATTLDLPEGIEMVPGDIWLHHKTGLPWQKQEDGRWRRLR